MSRPRASNRLVPLIEHAARVFMAKGYRQTQMSDVARSLGIAPGTVYLYVESKESLFDLVMRYALGTDLSQEMELPVKRTSETALLEFFERTLRDEMRFPALESAPQTVTPEYAGRELEVVVRELFRKTAKMWLALKLLEKAASDWPELTELWFGTYRPRIFRLMAEYLAKRMQKGVLRPAPDPVGAARLVLEMIATMAMHCRAEARNGEYDAALMEELVVDAVVHAYILPPRDESRPGRKLKASK